MSLREGLSWLAAIVVTECHGLEPERQEHRLGRDLQIVAIEMVQDCAYMAQTQVRKDKASNVALLHVSWCQGHNGVADATHGQNMADGHAEEIGHAENAYRNIDCVAELGSAHAKMQKPADRQHTQPDHQQADLVLWKVKVPCKRPHTHIVYKFTCFAQSVQKLHHFDSYLYSNLLTRL